MPLRGFGSLRRPTKQGGNPAVRLKTLRDGSTIHSAYLSALSKSIGSWEAGKPGYEFCNMDGTGDCRNQSGFEKQFPLNVKEYMYM